MVAVCFLVQAVASGVGIYLFSLFADAIIHSYHSSRTLVMFAATGSGLLSALVGPWIGGLMDKRSLRAVSAGCAVIMGAGLILAAAIPSIWSFILSSLLLVSVGATGLSVIMAPLLLTRWFPDRPGLAIGIALLGAQAGGLVLSPIAARLINQYGWRVAMAFFGVLLLFGVSLLIKFLVIDNPRGSSQSGTVDSGNVEFDKNHRSIFLEYLKDKDFWIATLALGAITAVINTLLTNLSLLVTDLGSAISVAARLLSLFALVAMASNVVFGKLLDMTSVKAVFGALILLSILAVSGLLYSHRMATIVVCVVCVAMAFGGAGPATAILVERLYGARNYGQAMGSIALFAGLIGTAAPILAGWSYDAVGSYRPMLMGLVACAIAALVTWPFIRTGRRGVVS